MKRLLYIIIVLLAACNQYDMPEVYDITVVARFPEDHKSGATIEGAEIKLRDTQTGRSHTLISDTSGQAHFNVKGGVYDISVAFTDSQGKAFNGLLADTILLQQKILM